MSSVRETSKESAVVLIVDDETVFRESLCRAFRRRGWEAHDASGGTAALEAARRISPDLVLLDLKMPNTSGLDLIEPIKELDSTITLIILTGYGSIPTAMDALKLGADHYLSKPVLSLIH